MKLSLGFSPCPNDTFIFDAWVNGKIDTGGLEVEPVLEDVETLNQWALEGKLDITKLSFPAFFQSLDNYVLLNSGSALGKGVGPLLVSKLEVARPPARAGTDGDDPVGRGDWRLEVARPPANGGTVGRGSQKQEIASSTIVLPGLNTTANLLFSFAFPSANKKEFVRYDEIEDFILKMSSEVSRTGASDPPNGEGWEGNSLEGAVFGVIIHENRFTYQQKGLHKWMDLGEYWEKKMNMPVPLGGIAIKRSVDRQVALQVDALIKKSLAYAFANYPLISDYVKVHSQTMSEAVMRQHIDLYVNDFSQALGEEGKKAIRALHTIFMSLQTTPGNTLSSSGLFLS